MQATTEARASEPMARAGESAREITQSATVIPKLSAKRIAVGLAGVALVLLYIGSRVFGTPIDSVLEQEVATENGLTLFTTLSGLGGFLASVIASTQISQFPGETIPIGAFVVPSLVTITGTVIAAMMVPSG